MDEKRAREAKERASALRQQMAEIMESAAMVRADSRNARLQSRAAISISKAMRRLRLLYAGERPPPRNED